MVLGFEDAGIEESDPARLGRASHAYSLMGLAAFSPFAWIVTGIILVLLLPLLGGLGSALLPVLWLIPFGASALFLLVGLFAPPAILLTAGNRFVRFHAFQAVALEAVFVIAAAVMVVLPLLFYLFAYNSAWAGPLGPLSSLASCGTIPLGIAWLALVILMSNDAGKGRSPMLPLVGKAAKKSAGPDDRVEAEIFVKRG
jgi:uncharacterized membrane protein